MTNPQHNYDSLESDTFLSLIFSGLPYKLAEKLAADTTNLYFDDSISDKEKEDYLQAYLSFLSLGAPTEQAYSFAKGTFKLFDDIKKYQE